jgi:hypothetical protein
MATAWPRTVGGIGTITVTYTAGFTDPADVPEPIKQAMFVLVAGYYADREGGDVAKAAEKSAKAILDNAGMRVRRL